MLTPTRRQWIAAVVAVLLLTLPTLAQDEAEVEGPWPFFLIVRGEVDAAMMAEYNDAVGKMVAAHKQHDNGNNWAAFTRLTGSEDPRFHFFVPMTTMGEMDGWTPNFQIVAAAHGRETAQEVFETLQKCWKAESLLLAYNPGISNPPEGLGGQPPPAAWHLKVTIDPGMVFEYIGLVQKVVEAHTGHDNGLNWIGYQNSIGGHGNEFHYFIMMEKIGDIDTLPSNDEVMIETVGAETWGEMQKRMTDIGNAESEILVFSPFHSTRMPKGGDE